MLILNTLMNLVTLSGQKVKGTKLNFVYDTIQKTLQSRVQGERG